MVVMLISHTIMVIGSYGVECEEIPKVKSL